MLASVDFDVNEPTCELSQLYDGSMAETYSSKVKEPKLVTQLSFKLLIVSYEQ
jgi:hypothetical protein